MKNKIFFYAILVSLVNISCTKKLDYNFKMSNVDLLNLEKSSFLIFTESKTMDNYESNYPYNSVIGIIPNIQKSFKIFEPEFYVKSIIYDKEKKQFSFLSPFTDSKFFEKNEKFRSKYDLIEYDIIKNEYKLIALEYNSRELLIENLLYVGDQKYLVDNHNIYVLDDHSSVHKLFEFEKSSKIKNVYFHEKNGVLSIVSSNLNENLMTLTIYNLHNKEVLYEYKTKYLLKFLGSDNIENKMFLSEKDLVELDLNNFCLKSFKYSSYFTDVKINGLHRLSKSEYIINSQNDKNYDQFGHLEDGPDLFLFNTEKKHITPLTKTDKDKSPFYIVN
ncbi:MAG: hypothetical protein ACEPO8_15290 [Rhodothermaceae bacterium]